jgi:aspartate/methionine/tyrosine aminotransferase
MSGLRMHIAQRVRETTSPPVDLMNAHAERLRRQGVPIISLGQAIPGFPAAPGIVEAARTALEEADTHRYSPDAGMPALREAIASVLARDRNVSIDPHSDLIITTGGNQAFLLALLTLLEPGDRVLLPSPYFLNHEMAVRIAGGIPVEVPLTEESGYQLRLRDLEPFLKQPARALVVVSPNNPTGAVFDCDELCRVGVAMAERDITLLADDTYQDYVYAGARHLSLASVPTLRGQVLLTCSYSKTYSITGWRLGFLAGPPDFIREAMKVQDSMVICAPVIAQKAVLGALREPPDELKRRLSLLDQRRRFLATRLSQIPRLQWCPTEGAFFAFVRVEGCADSQGLALDVLHSAHVLTIPGRAFGKHGEGCLRLSYGSVDLPDLEEACRRLERYFT